MSAFLKSIQKKIGNSNSSIVSDGIVGDLSGFIDTGSLLLNAAASGSMFKGFPDNKISSLAGPAGVGKSFILLTMIARFLKKYPKATTVFFESESAQRKDIMEGFGIDVSRVLFVPITTVQELRSQALQVLEEYEKIPEKDRIEAKLFLCLDSLGNLSTIKEMEDASSGKEVQDMTRAKLIKSTFRVITLKLGVLGVPFICTNHIYMSQGSMYPQAQTGGGCLLAGSQIIMGDGSFKNIEEIKVGDEVLTETNKAKVIKTWDETNLEKPNPICYRVYFDDETFVECSEDHKFRKNGIWTKITDLYNGDELNTIFNFNKTITKIENIGHNFVYDIEVEDAHHYVLSNSLLSHNSGPSYNSSTIVILSKRKEKDGTDFIGNLVHCKMEKSRFTKEGTTVDILINFSSGLSQYHGVLDFAVEFGMVKALGTRYEFPSGEKVFKKEIYKNPEKYFVPELLELIDEKLQNKFLYGSIKLNMADGDVSEEDESSENENIEI